MNLLTGTAGVSPAMGILAAQVEAMYFGYSRRSGRDARGPSNAKPLLNQVGW
jgi:hypothetical protein